MLESKKMNIASYRVLKTLLCLFRKSLTMPELISQLKEAGYGPYNKYTVTKYIHTLKMCGIDIQRFQNRYYIINFPLGIKFSALDTELIYDIKEVAEKINLNGMKTTINSFIEKLHLPFYKCGNGEFSSENHRIIKTLKIAYHTQSNIILTHLDLRKCECYIKDIKVAGGKYVYTFVSSDQQWDLTPDEINDVELLGKKSKINYSNIGVVYELSGRLAERYQLRENEHILRYSSHGGIVISNEHENRFDLMQRLLRYDSLCKVISPDDFLQEFLSNIYNSLDNYGIDETRKSKKYITNKLIKKQEREKERQRQLEQEQEQEEQAQQEKSAEQEKSEEKKETKQSKKGKKE